MSDAALVPAGLQSALFGDVALEQLAQIVADDQLGDSKEVACGMLMSLCTNPTHGLCPESASAWGPPLGAKIGAFGGGQGRLLRFMRRLQAIKVVQHREILLATTRATPRLAAAYLDSVPFFVEPQPAPVW
jgi:nucleolar pre-ribosomal-associated protein 1